MSGLAIKVGLMLGATTLVITAAPGAHAQTASRSGDAAKASGGQDAGAANSDIIVTARRVEERLQDVPISITVYNQQQLADKNVISANDLATYTPSLSADTAYGDDNVTFAIRGFAQDNGTAPSVGIYFADVVTPRGASNGIPVGDGASAGDFFDLANVQVLKGPQGTLFGRNTTGGAVLFVPQKPVDRLEGYVEGGLGDYNERRIQAVINIPLADSFRVRLGVDRMVRDGYLHNVSGIGPGRFGNVDYTSVRLSAVGDLTPNLENYIIASYGISNNSGAIEKLVAANAGQGVLIPGAPVSFGGLAAAQLAGQGNGFYNVENPVPQAHLRTQQWQIIDTITWKTTDSLTIKNIASYAQLKQQGASPLFGVNWRVPVNGTIYNTNFEEATSPPGLNTADESTFTDEFRFQGSTSSNRFNWQAGAYLEVVRPLEKVGSQSPGFASCADGNGATFNCTDPIGAADEPAYVALLQSFGLAVPAGTRFNIAQINITEGTTAFHDVGFYAQGTYKLAEKLKLTGGIRYTSDDEVIDTVQKVYQLNAAPNYGVQSSSCANPIATFPVCFTKFLTKSHAPTWLIDLDYTPTGDILTYAKYSRGYRAATIAPNIPEAGTVAAPDTSLNYIKPEKVDSYEVGLKSSFARQLHGLFNVSAFYNKLSNQQLEVGFIPFNPGLYPQTAAPVNAGKSKIYGAEVEASITPIENLNFTLGYTYLRSRIDAVVALPSNPAYHTNSPFNVGDPEVLAPRNKLTVGANYRVPMPAALGRVSVGLSMTYRSSMLTNYADRSNPDPALAAFGVLPSLTLVNGNLNWTNVANRPLDLAFFVTNLTDRKYYTFTPGLGTTSLGFEAANVGEPRMFGGTAKVRF